MPNTIHELLSRAAFDAEQKVSEIGGSTKSSADSRNMLIARVSRVRPADSESIGIELVASRKGWECFTNILINQGYRAETRRWAPFGDNEYRYDLYLGLES